MLCAAAGLRRFSTKLWPLESEDEIVALLLGMARYPVDTLDTGPAPYAITPITPITCYGLL